MLHEIILPTGRVGAEPNVATTFVRADNTEDETKQVIVQQTHGSVTYQQIMRYNAASELIKIEAWEVAP